mmetsp:Transcript_27207/g.49206  ORF Transcript_27207/g.49206 Transcript_27207/m.49206 type:complete len:212 (-) Transcript_27207:285-920(-)
MAASWLQPRLLCVSLRDAPPLELAVPNPGGRIEQPLQQGPRRQTKGPGGETPKGPCENMPPGTLDLDETGCEATVEEMQQQWCTKSRNYQVPQRAKVVQLIGPTSPLCSGRPRLSGTCCARPGPLPRQQKQLWQRFSRLRQGRRSAGRKGCESRLTEKAESRNIASGIEAIASEASSPRLQVQFLQELHHQWPRVACDTHALAAKSEALCS